MMATGMRREVLILTTAGTIRPASSPSADGLRLSGRTVRPARGAFLRDTYGFRGAEGDVRAAGAIPAGVLSAPGARMKLLACLGSGLDGARIASVCAGDDG